MLNLDADTHQLGDDQGTVSYGYSWSVVTGT